MCAVRLGRRGVCFVLGVCSWEVVVCVVLGEGRGVCVVLWECGVCVDLEAWCVVAWGVWNVLFLCVCFVLGSVVCVLCSWCQEL